MVWMVYHLRLHILSCDRSIKCPKQIWSAVCKILVWNNLVMDRLCVDWFLDNDRRMVNDLRAHIVPWLCNRNILPLYSNWIDDSRVMGYVIGPRHMTNYNRLAFIDSDLFCYWFIRRRVVSSLMAIYFLSCDDSFRTSADAWCETNLSRFADSDSSARRRA